MKRTNTIYLNLERPNTMHLNLERNNTMHLNLAFILSQIDKTHRTQSSNLNTMVWRGKADVFGSLRNAT